MAWRLQPGFDRHAGFCRLSTKLTDFGAKLTSGGVKIVWYNWYNEREKKKGTYLMKIAVCDDCYEDALLLKTFLDGHDVRIYTDAAQLLADAENSHILFDLYLLDIYMDDAMNGIELAKRLRLQDEDAALCFISSSDVFYREAYDVYAMQYLIKPVDAEMLEQLIKRVSRNIVRNKEQSLCYKWRGQAGAIPYGQILYISSREHTLYIHCKDGRVQECKGKLEEMARQVCGEVFFRCHQSFIVNMYQADRWEGNELVVAGRRVPVSRRYYTEVKRRYQEILFEEVD